MHQSITAQFLKLNAIRAVSLYTTYYNNNNNDNDNDNENSLF